MKICHFTIHHRYGDSRIIKELTSLNRKGFEIIFIAKKGIENEKPKYVEVWELPKEFSNKSRLAKLLSISFWKYLVKAMKEGVILFHFHDPDLIPVGILLKILGKKVIYDVHENNKYILLNHSQGLIYRIIANVWEFFERLLSIAFDFIVATDKLIFKKFPPSKTTIVTNMPPVSMFRDLEIKKNDANPKMKLVHAGELNKNRGSEVLLNALKLMKYARDIEVYLIGGTDSEGFRDFGDLIKIYKRVPFSELMKMYSLFDVGIFLYQPIPAHLVLTGERNTKIFEYMAAGLPIIMSDLKLLRKTFEPIGCCIFVDPTNPEEVADAIDYLYENPDVRREMGLKGRRAFLEKYNWEEQEKRLLRAYKKVLNLP